MKSLKNFGVSYNETTLINDIKLYSFYKTNAPIYFRIFFSAGSQFDGDKPGLAHFCEHIIVSGTEKYPTKDTLNKKIEEIGARKNAFTNKKNLWLTFDLADKNDLPDLFEIVEQILNKSIFEPKTIESERKAVLAEQTRKISNPAQYIIDLQSSLLFQNTIIENPALGFDDSVKNITRDDLLNYRDKYLLNGEVAYFVSGDFDEKLVAESLNRIKNNFKPINLLDSALPIITDKKEIIKTQVGTEQNYISFSTRVTPINNKNNQITADVFNIILGQGSTSRLHNILRNDKGLVYNVSSNFYYSNDCAYLTINTNCKPKDTKEVKEIVSAEFTKIIKDGISSEELERAKKSIYRNIKFQSEGAEFFVNTIMMTQLTANSNSVLPDEYLEILNSLSVDDVNNFAQKYLSNKELLFTGIGDFGSLSQ